MKTVIYTVGKPETGLMDIRSYVKVLENAQSQTASAIKVDFMVTTETWKTKPKFVIDSIAPFERHIYTTNMIYMFVDGGTKRHEIRPKRPGYPLRFQWGGKGSYKSKTVTRKIYSRPGGSTGPIVRMKVVDHPGFPARDFSGTIGDKWQKQYPIQIQRAINSVGYDNA